MSNRNNAGNGEWQSFTFEGNGRYARRGGAGAPDESSAAELREDRDNNTRRGFDRYGSRQAINTQAAEPADLPTDPDREDSLIAGIVSFLADVLFKKLKINANSAASYLIGLILALALSFSIVYALVKTSGLIISPLTVFFTCAALLIFFSALFYNAYVANGAILAAIAVFGVYFFYLYRTEKLEDYRIIASYYFNRFTYWAASFFYMGQPHIERYEAVLFMIVCSVVCLFVYFITIKRFIFPLMFAAGFTTFCLQWCYGFFAGYTPFFIFICVIFFGYIWHIYLKNRDRYENPAALFSPVRFLKPLTPLLLFMVLMIAIAPTPGRPIYWQWLYDVYHRVTGGFYDRFYYHRVDSFALNTTGFSSGESFLSGPVRINNTHVLSVVSGDRALYIKGNGKEEYTGASWKNRPRLYWQGEQNNALSPAGDGAAGAQLPRDGSGSPYGDGLNGDGAAGIAIPDNLDDIWWDEQRLMQAPWGLKDPGPDRLNLPGTNADQIMMLQPARNVYGLLKPFDVPDREAALAAAGAEAEIAEAEIANGLARPRFERLNYAVALAPATAVNPDAANGASGAPGADGMDAALFEHRVTDLDSPDLTDVREMEEALARMKPGVPDRTPGPLYYGGNTEVDRDVEEYTHNQMLYMFRLMAGGDTPSLTGLGANAETLRRSGRWSLRQNVMNAVVWYDRMKTFSMFTPTKLLRLFNFNIDAGEVYEEGGALSLERIMEEGFCYEFDYYPEDRHSVDSQMLLYNSYPGLYRDLIEDFSVAVVESRLSGGAPSASISSRMADALSAYEGTRGSRADAQTQSQPGRQSRSQQQAQPGSQPRPGAGAFYLEIGDFIEWDELMGLAYRADDIRRRYTALPEDLPERVWILAEQLTGGAEFDYEKALTLEQFLYTNYNYSLNVGYLASGEDFVDNFLFSQTEGYCTHFASALAVMARCVGLPSRYVEGYTLPEEMGEDGIYRITNAEAHAWVEIYFEGYGWRVFEPTATYQDRFYISEYDIDPYYMFAGSMGVDMYDYMDDMMREADYFGYQGAFDPGIGGNADATAAIINIVVRVGLIALAVLIPIATVAFGRRRANVRFLAFSAEPDRAVRSMYRHYVKILKKLQYSIKQGETLTQFAARADAALRIGKFGLASAIDVFEKLAYSDHAITEADKQRARAVYPHLLTAYSLRKNKLTFFFVKDVIADI